MLHGRWVPGAKGQDAEVLEKEEEAHLGEGGASRQGHQLGGQGGQQCQDILYRS